MYQMNESKTWLPALSLLPLTPWPLSKLLCALRPSGLTCKVRGRVSNTLKAAFSFLQDLQQSCQSSVQRDLSASPYLSWHPTGSSLKTVRSQTPPPLGLHLTAPPLPPSRVHLGSELSSSPPLPAVKTQKDPTSDNLTH